MLKGPAFRFKPGRVVEIEHTSGRFGYLIAHFRKPRFGQYFTLVTETFGAAIRDDQIAQLLDSPRTTVWLNTYNLLSTIGPFTLRHKGDLPGYSPQEPAFWGGLDLNTAPSPTKKTTIWIEQPDGTTEKRSGLHSEREWEEEMERAGIISSVLWLPKSIGEFLFEGRPLRWSAHKRY